MKEMLSPSQLVSAFFTLTSSRASYLRKSTFTQIHEIVFHGQGGYDWETVYNMPLWLRRFTFEQIKDYYNQKSKKIQDSQPKTPGQTTVIDSSGKVKSREHLKRPSYR